MPEWSPEARLAKMEMAIAVIQNQLTDVKANTVEIIGHVKETNGRVSVLERGQWLAMGAIGVIVFAMGTFGVWALTMIGE